MRNESYTSSTQSGKWPKATAEHGFTDFQERVADQSQLLDHLRAQCELRLLACIAPIGRWGLALARRAGIGISHFQQPDARIIFAAMLVADEIGFIGDRTRTALLCRDAIAQINLWDATDNRRLIGAMTWGPGPLTELFFRVTRFEAEEFLPEAAAGLIEAANRINHFIATAGPKVRPVRPMKEVIAQ